MKLSPEYKQYKDILAAPCTWSDVPLDRYEQVLDIFGDQDATPGYIWEEKCEVHMDLPLNMRACDGYRCKICHYPTAKEWTWGCPRELSVEHALWEAIHNE